MASNACITARALALCALATGVEVLLLRLAQLRLNDARPALTGPGDVDALTDVLAAVAATALLMAWTWLIAAGALITMDVLRGHRRARPRLAMPGGWQRMLVALLGAGVVWLPATSHAHDGAVDPPAPAGPVSAGLDGLRLPDRPYGAGAGPQVSPRPATYVVEPGDTLWSVARRHLGRRATDAEVAMAWPRWYRANSTVIGADPDLIVPGTVLRSPGPPTAPARTPTDPAGTDPAQTDGGHR